MRCRIESRPKSVLHAMRSIDLSYRAVVCSVRRQTVFDRITHREPWELRLATRTPGGGVDRRPGGSRGNRIFQDGSCASPLEVARLDAGPAFSPKAHTLQRSNLDNEGAYVGRRIRSPDSG